MRFRDIIGQEHITGHLHNVLREGKVSHAYLLQGEEGNGKRLLAETFAMTLQCEEQGMEPCGTCRSCRQAASGNHPDIRYVTHEKATIGVDDIRLQLNNDILVKPYNGPYKVYLIEDAEKMTEQAQNAMLKTIEEPPEYAVILLLTVNEKLLLPTIRSRCVLWRLRPAAKADIVKLLTDKYGIASYMAELAADFSDGMPGRAVAYASSEEFSVRREETVRLLRRLDRITARERYAAVKGWAGQKQAVPELLALIRLWYRDVLVEKASGGTAKLVFREEEAELARQARQLSYDELERRFQALELFSQRLNANVNFEAAAELLLMTLKGTVDGYDKGNRSAVP